MKSIHILNNNRVYNLYVCNLYECHLGWNCKYIQQNQQSHKKKQFGKHQKCGWFLISHKLLLSNVYVTNVKPKQNVILQRKSEYNFTSSILMPFHKKK
jgi:hypothetical protein